MGLLDYCLYCTGDSLGLVRNGTLVLVRKRGLSAYITV
jgi:hypothetical protein